MALSESVKEQAEALGIELDSRWNDRTVLKKIKKVLGESEEVQSYAEVSEGEEDGEVIESTELELTMPKEESEIIGLTIESIQEEKSEFPKTMTLKNLVPNIKSFVSFEIPARGEVTIEVKDERTMRRIKRAIETKQIEEV